MHDEGGTTGKSEVFSLRKTEGTKLVELFGTVSEMNRPCRVPLETGDLAPRYRT